jgi:glycosyltransferase involved in cell wall biosynthesis
VPDPLPLVSVVVAAYRHEPFVNEALQSVFDQDYQAVELIVIDDKSPDHTASVVREFVNRVDVKNRFRRILFVENDRNLGAHATINRGLRESQGDYINILNSDDRFAPTRLSRLVSVCEERQAQFAFTQVELLTVDRTVLANEIEYFSRIQDNIERFPTVGYAFLRNQCALSTGNFFFSRRVYEQVGEFRALTYCHDWDFVLRSLLVTEPIFVPEVLYVYRLHPGNSFLQLQRLAESDGETLLRNYLFLCRNRPVTNPLAPSPSWGPFFSEFLHETHLTHFSRP